MGAISGLLGFGGGAAGTAFANPQQASLYNPVTAPQISTSYGNTANSLSQQQQLLSALQAQQGLSNQSNVYNQLQNVTNGTGPNPAQAMLAQQTGANVANQAALMAGQRGASANVGLLARQAAQQGAATQQQAAGQAATMQAQQSLGALGQQAGIANAQASNQIGQTNANTQAQQAEQAALLQSQAAFNNAQVGMQSNINTANAGLANTQMGGQQSLIGGVLNMVGGGSNVAKANGGVIHGYDQGGEVAQFPSGVYSGGPQSKFGQYLNQRTIESQPMQASQPMAGNDSGNEALQNGVTSFGKGIGSLFHSSPSQTQMAGGPMDNTGIGSMGMDDQGAMMNAARGGKVPAMVSPGEKYLKPAEAKAVAKGKANPAQVGKVIPGTPQYKGNNYANDVVPATLDEGGVVIPNSVMQSKDPAKGAADFVRAVMAKKRMKS